MNRRDLYFPKLTREQVYKKDPEGQYFNYGKYKNDVRTDCLGRCVYCDIHENENGGPENMQLDHFRPSSNPRFEHLTNDPRNLHWSCAKCNRLKSNHWPSENDSLTFEDEAGFIDPFSEDRSEYFKVCITGDLIPLKSPAKYKVALLALNRPTRSRLRLKRLQSVILCEKLKENIQKLKTAAESVQTPSSLKQLLKDQIEDQRNAS